MAPPAPDGPPPDPAPTATPVGPTSAGPNLDGAGPTAREPPPAVVDLAGSDRQTPPRRRWLLATVMAALVVVVVALVLRRGEDQAPLTPGASSSVATALTGAERSAFLARCRSTRSTPAQCRCALDRLEQGRPAAESAADVRLTLAAKAGEGLQPGVQAALASCVRSS